MKVMTVSHACETTMGSAMASSSRTPPADGAVAVSPASSLVLNMHAFQVCLIWRMCVFGAMLRGELVDREYSLWNDTCLTPDDNGWPGVFWFECRCLCGQCFSPGLRTSAFTLSGRQAFPDPSIRIPYSKNDQPHPMVPGIVRGWSVPEPPDEHGGLVFSSTCASGRKGAPRDRTLLERSWRPCSGRSATGWGSSIRRRSRPR